MREITYLEWFISLFFIALVALSTYRRRSSVVASLVSACIIYLLNGFSAYALRQHVASDLTHLLLFTLCISLYSAVIASHELYAKNKT